MIEVWPVHYSLVGLIDVDVGHATQGVDVGRTDRLAIVRGGRRADELTHGPPGMPITAQAPLPVVDVEPVTQQSIAGFVGSVSTARAAPDLRHTFHRLERRSVGSTHLPDHPLSHRQRRCPASG